MLLLLILPLAVIPYVPALFVWLGATWYAFYRALRLTGHEGAVHSVDQVVPPFVD